MKSSTHSSPSHAPMNQFPVTDNQLQVGGKTVEALAEAAGTVPFYAYDRAVIEKQVATLRAEFPSALHLHYAMKANPMPEVVNHLAGLTDGLDVASAGELAVALASGTAPRKISFAGPGKSDADLAAAIDAGVIINLESTGEMRRVAKMSAARGLRPPVSVRVNADFELKSAGMKMGGGPKPFGIDSEYMPEVLAELDTLPIDFVGFHIYSGSQNLRPEAIVEAHEQTFELAWRLASLAPAKVRWLNMGGGLGVPYFPGERRLELGAIAANLSRLMKANETQLPDTEIVMELGRYLVAESGIYVCQVIDRKVSRGETFLVTNGGLHHHLAVSGNFGQVIRKNYPVCVANRLQSADMEQVTVVGPLCTPMDILADKVTLPRAEPGDFIAVFQSGAYGFSASPHGFLSHPAPAELIV